MRKLVALLAVGTSALVGCGSGGSSKGASDGGSTTTDAGSKGSDTTDAGSNGDNSELSKLLEKTKSAKYKVTYQSGDDDPFTIAQDPPRFVYSSGDSATYVLEDGSAVSCSGTGSEATCTKMPGSGESIQAGLSAGFGAFGALFLSEAAKGIPGLGDIKTNEEKIAGRDASCATIDGSTLGALGAAIKGSYSVCIDKETGVMLRVKSEDGSGTTSDITATDFGEPSDDDFTPPVTPVTIPGQ